MFDIYQRISGFDLTLCFLTGLKLVGFILVI